MREKEPVQLVKGSCLDQNTTLEALIKWGLIFAGILLTLQLVEKLTLSLNAPVPSITHGCVVPASLMTNKSLPIPGTLAKDATYDEATAHREGIIIELQRFSGALIADRSDLARRCS